MKTIKYIIPIIAILSVCMETLAQSGANDPERFYNVKTYKADITVTFDYRLSESESGSTRSVSVSQKFRHSFNTGLGQITVGDMFQIARGDKGDNRTHEGDIFEGVDMKAVSQALKNSGVDPSVMGKLKKTKEETQSYNMGFDKYKMWMTSHEGFVSSSIHTVFSDEESGSLHCGEGQGMGSFDDKKNYKGSAQTSLSKPDLNNPNSFILQLNLDNNSYSFMTTVKMPIESQFIGSNYSKQCSYISNDMLEMGAHSFIGINKPGEGLIYKHPLPESGLILSGTEVITDRFSLERNLSEKDGKWSVKIDWTIYPADLGVPEVFISYKNDVEGKNWIPEDGNDIEAIMEWEGNYKPEIIEWELSDVSDEPGTCLNSEDKNEEFDLEFEESLKEKGYDVVKTETGYTARKEGNNKVGKESILIISKDYGSYGLLSGKIKVNGIWCDAYDKELGNNGLSIPLDKNYNNIADKWESDNMINAGIPNNWDEENAPVLDGEKGDGLSLYEEYRGIMAMKNDILSEHTRLDPNMKELIVFNEIGPQINPGLALFEKATSIKVIISKYTKFNNMNPTSRIVNMNYATGHNQYQYGVVITSRHGQTDFGQAQPLTLLNKTPKLTRQIVISEDHMNAKFEDQGGMNCSYNYRNREHFESILAQLIMETVAHELGHAVGANHHGDTDANGETLTSVLDISRRAFDLSGKEIKDRPLVICSPIGKIHGQSSGSMTCIMRYNKLYSWLYKTTDDDPTIQGGSIYYYQVKDEQNLTTFCTSDAGGSNIFGNAKEDHGNCLERLRVKDGPSPWR